MYITKLTSVDVFSDLFFIRLNDLITNLNCFVIEKHHIIGSLNLEGRRTGEFKKVVIQELQLI